MAECGDGSEKGWERGGEEGLECFLLKKKRVRCEEDGEDGEVWENEA